MRSNGFANFFMALATCAALTFAMSAATPTVVEAQACTGSACTPVRADGKGMIGLGLIGGELGLIIPALVQNAAHTNEWWPYLVFPLLGIAAGIGGGYGLEVATGGWGSSSPNLPEVDIGIMIGAAVLVIPTILGTLALSSWSPPAESASGDEDFGPDTGTSSGDSVEAVQDSSSSDAVQDSSSSSGSTDSSSTPPPSSSSSTTGGTSSLLPRTPSDALAGGPGAIRFDGQGNRILLGVPMVGAIGRYSAEEMSSLHIAQQYDVNVPVVSATF